MTVPAASDPTPDIERRWLQTADGWVRCDSVVAISESRAYGRTVVQGACGTHLMPKGSSPTETLVTLLDATEQDIRDAYSEERADA